MPVWKRSFQQCQKNKNKQNKTKQKPKLKFFLFFSPDVELCHYLSWLHVKVKQKHIHDLVNVINNYTKFQLNRIRIHNFLLKLLETAVTLKYGQGHWK